MLGFVGTFFLWAVQWVWYSGYMWWNMLICETIAGNAELNPDASPRLAIGLYTFLGGIGWGLVVFFFGLLVYMFCSNFVPKGARLRQEEYDLPTYIFIYPVLAYILLGTVTFQDPFADLRQYRMNQAAFDYGGLGIIGCYQDNPEDPQGLTIRETDVWVYLSDEGWTVDIANRTTAYHPEDKNWRYIIAPIVYNGTWWNYSCAIEPPVYAVCAVRKSDPTLKDCGWELPSPLTYRVTIRKTRWGEFIDTTERRIFPTPPNPNITRENKSYERNHRLFDFNAYSMYETQEKTGQTEADLYNYKRRMMYIWIGLSLAVALVYFIYASDIGSSDDSDGSMSKEPESEMYGVSSTPDQSTELQPVVVPPVAPLTESEVDGGRYTEEDLTGGVYRNATINTCDLTDVKLINCTIRKADFKGSCTLDHCDTREVDVYGTVVRLGGTFSCADLKSGGKVVDAEGRAMTWE